MHLLSILTLVTDVHFLSVLMYEAYETENEYKNQ